MTMMTRAAGTIAEIAARLLWWTGLLDCQQIALHPRHSNTAMLEYPSARRMSGRREGPAPTSRMTASFARPHARIRCKEVSGMAWNQPTASSTLVVKTSSECFCRVPGMVISSRADLSG
jgi:hypothetical protein